MISDETWILVKTMKSIILQAMPVKTRDVSVAAEQQAASMDKVANSANNRLIDPDLICYWHTWFEPIVDGIACPIIARYNVRRTHYIWRLFLRKEKDISRIV